MLAIIVMTFAFLWLPYRLLVVYNSFAEPPYHSLWFRQFCRIMVYSNSAINPILYSAMSIKFRTAFKTLLSCQRGRDVTAHTGVYTNYQQVSMAPTAATHCAKAERSDSAVETVVPQRLAIPKTNV